LLPKYVASIGKIKNKITNVDGLTRVYFAVDAFTPDSGHDDFEWHFVDFDDRRAPVRFHRQREAPAV